MKWIDIEEIIELLDENYPEKDLINMRFTELQKIILSLPNFNDDVTRCNEKILEVIQAGWIEFRNEK